MHTRQNLFLTVVSLHFYQYTTHFTELMQKNWNEPFNEAIEGWNNDVENFLYFIRHLAYPDAVEQEKKESREWMVSIGYPLIICTVWRCWDSEDTRERDIYRLKSSSLLCPQHVWSPLLGWPLTHRYLFKAATCAFVSELTAALRLALGAACCFAASGELSRVGLQHLRYCTGRYLPAYLRSGHCLRRRSVSLQLSRLPAMGKPQRNQVQGRRQIFRNTNRVHMLSAVGVTSPMKMAKAEQHTCVRH